MVKDTTQEIGEKSNAPKKPFDFLIKVVLGGNDHVGKTSLLTRFVRGDFHDHYIATIGIDFMVKEVETKNGDNVKVQAWDLAGQERFRSITNSYYRGAMGMLLVYDVTERDTFEHMDQSLLEVQRFASEDIIVFLVGNKADLNDSKRQVTYEEGKRYADENGLQFFETSARDNINVKEVFEKFVEAVVDQYKARRAAAEADPKKSSKSSEKLRPMAQTEPKAKEPKNKSSTCVLL